MEDYTDIDMRIETIWKEINRVSKDIMCYYNQWPPIWEPPLSEEEVSQFEKEKGIRFPKDYRRFITTKASGGNLPYYGLYSPVKPKPSYILESVPEKPFPYTIDKPLRIMEDIYSNHDIDTGFLILCTEGCGMDNILIVNTTDPSTYGTVWFYDIADDFGIVPFLHPKTKKPICFLDWLESFVSV